MCKCQICEKEYSIDIIVPDNIWEQIKPAGKPIGSGLLCGKCIIERMEKIFKYASWHLISPADFCSYTKETTFGTTPDKVEFSGGAWKPFNENTWEWGINSIKPGKEIFPNKEATEPLLGQKSVSGTLQIEWCDVENIKKIFSPTCSCGADLSFLVYIMGIIMKSNSICVGILCSNPECNHTFTFQKD